MSSLITLVSILKINKKKKTLAHRQPACLLSPVSEPNDRTRVLVLAAHSASGTGGGGSSTEVSDEAGAYLGQDTRTHTEPIFLSKFIFQGEHAGEFVTKQSC